MEDEKKLYPFSFVPKREECPWGARTWQLADLGFVDTKVSRGWLAGNPLSDLMHIFLERVVGDEAFNRYGTQFPVSVETLEITGRTSLQVNPDDQAAEQRYDAFGRTALWYVAEAGEDARLYLGFEREVSPAAFYEACADGSVERLLHTVRPKAGDAFLLPPGLVHAAKGPLKLIVISEASGLYFRLHDWDYGRDCFLEEAFDLIDYRAWNPALHRRSAGGASERLFATQQFTVSEFRLKDPVRVEASDPEGFFVYACVRGGATVQLPSGEGQGVDCYPLKAGGVLLVPAELPGFAIVPTDRDTVLLETILEPFREPDAYINRDAAPYLDGEDYSILEGDGDDPEDEFSDWSGPDFLS